MAVDAARRRAVEERAGWRCEYCHLVAEPSALPLQVDHVFALQHGGKDDLENPALACGQCNRHKGTNLATLDRASRLPLLLFHPRHHRWVEHFSVASGTIAGISPRGRATVELLRFNLPDRVERRKLLERARGN